jgi:very-short-patch-repair endonuclease
VLGSSGILWVSGTRDQRIAAIASVQRGRVSRRQLLSAGITDAMVHRLTAVSALHRVHHGVYAVGHLAPIELGRETAALLAFPPGAVLSHTTAAGVWAMRPLPENGDIEVTRLDADGHRTGVRVHRTHVLDGCDMRIHRGLPITSPARTLLDLAGILTPREHERALDEALIQRLVRLQDIRRILERMPLRAGAPALRALLEARQSSTLTRSQAEERFLELIRAAGLPLPQVNVHLHGFTVDFYWPEQRVVVEIDGYRYHSTRSAFERDRRKDGVLRAAGIDVHRISWGQMESEPFALVARMTMALVPPRTGEKAA